MYLVTSFHNFMRFLVVFFFFGCFFTKSFAQNSDQYSEILLEAENILYTQPQEALKIAEHLIQKSENPQQRIQAYLLTAGSYYAMGKFDDATKAIIEAKKLAENSKDMEMQIKTSISSIHLLNFLGMNLIAEEYFFRTKHITEQEENNKVAPYIEAGLKLINADKNLQKNEYQVVLKNLKDANIFFETSDDYILQNETRAAIIETYLNASHIDSAQHYFKTIHKDTFGEYPNNYITMVLQNQLGRLHFLKKDYSNSIASYNNALEISKRIENKYYESKIIEGLSATYLALDEASLFYANKTKSAILANEVETEEDKAVNSIYNYINYNHTTRTDQTKQKYQQNILILGSILLLILLSWIILRYRYNYRAKQYENFIKYFQDKQKPKEVIVVKEVSKTLNIPKETEEALIQKLNQFENSKQFTKQDMSLALLASSFDTNTKYLSEIINTHKNKNFNSYINELRINYIIDKLKNNNTYLQYKISYLAEESGFSSHSSFATVFKTVTGIPPTVFINLLSSKKAVSKANKTAYEEVQ